jgi:hypothetical protein
MLFYPARSRLRVFSRETVLCVKRILSIFGRIPLSFMVFGCYAVAITAPIGGVASAARADLEVFRADGLAALVGGSVPGPRVDIILRSDVELRARLRLSGQASGPLPTGPLPESLFEASLNEIVGEYLIAREAVRLRIAKPAPAKVAEEIRRIEQTAGGRDRLRSLLRTLSVSQDEVEEIARRRALVAAFLSLNLADVTIISDAQVEKAMRRTDNFAEQDDKTITDEELRARLARDAIDQTIARWIKVLRARTPVYIFHD